MIDGMNRALGAVVLLVALPLGLLHLGVAEPSDPQAGPAGPTAERRRADLAERIAIARTVRAARRRLQAASTVFRPLVAPWFDAPGVARDMPTAGVRWIIRVEDEDGRAVEGAKLTDGPDGPGSRDAPFEGLTGPDGIAIIDTEAAGRVAVRARKGDRFALLPGISPAPGQRIVVDLVLAPRVSIKGRVVTRNGQPFPDATICSTMKPGRVTRGPDGTFAISGECSSTPAAS
jgi:hypothetical protein